MRNIMNLLKEKAATSNAKENNFNGTPVVPSVEPIKSASEEVDILKELEIPLGSNDGEAAHEYLDELSLDDNLEAAGSFDYSLDCGKSNLKQVYDNAGAYATFMAIMNRDNRTDIQFKLDKDNYHYAWIESKGVAPFKYYLKNESFNGIVRFLMKGEATDFDPAPMDYEKAKFNDEFMIMKLFVDKGMTLQCTPLFREKPEYISAFLPCKKGKIIFRVKRTDYALNYLREAGQYI